VRTRSDGSVVPGVETAVLSCSAARVDDLLSEGVAAAVHRAGTIFSLMLDAHAVGAARHMIELTIEHVTSRSQFGQPVGRFQAVQHTLANMQVAAETSYSLMTAASESWRGRGDPSLSEVASSRLHAAAVAGRVCESAIQLHGGMGFTWEAGLHRWYRVARLSQHLLTDEPGLRRYLADEIRRSVQDERVPADAPA